MRAFFVSWCEKVETPLAKDNLWRRYRIEVEKIGLGG